MKEKVQSQEQAQEQVQEQVRSQVLNFHILLYLLSLYIFFLFLTIPLHAQRSEINEGVEQYNEQKFADAEVNFKKGKEKAPESFEAHFNLGDAYYKQQRYEESLKEFYSSLELAEEQDLRAKAYHNIGNSLLKSQKFKESIEAYKNALKINPNDQETKYNLSYALKQLEDQQNQQQNQQNQNQNQDENKDNQNQDQNKDKNQQQNDQKDQQQQNEQNKPDQNEQAQQDNTKQQQPKDQISKEEAERILQALKNNEQDIQKKIRKKTGVAVKKEKDW
jgi:Ca-activated chloride channel homolog